MQTRQIFKSIFLINHNDQILLIVLLSKSLFLIYFGSLFARFKSLNPNNMLSFARVIEIQWIAKQSIIIIIRCSQLRRDGLTLIKNAKNLIFVEEAPWTV